MAAAIHLFSRSQARKSLTGQAACRPESLLLTREVKCQLDDRAEIRGWNRSPEMRDLFTYKAAENSGSSAIRVRMAPLG